MALSGEGWIYAEAGYVAKGEDLLQKAETDDPSYDPPHLYRGLVLLEDQRRPAAAVKELKWYLAHGPDPSLAKTAKTALAQLKTSFRCSGEPLFEQLVAQSASDLFGQGRRDGVAYLAVLAGTPAGEGGAGGKPLEQCRFLHRDPASPRYFSVARRAAG